MMTIHFTSLDYFKRGITQATRLTRDALSSSLRSFKTKLNAL